MKTGSIHGSLSLSAARSKGKRCRDAQARAPLPDYPAEVTEPKGCPRLIGYRLLLRTGEPIRYDVGGVGRIHQSGVREDVGKIGEDLVEVPGDWARVQSQQS